MRSQAIILAGISFILLTAGVSGQEKRQISGVYPNLTVYGIYSQNGAHLLGGHNECGIGAVVPWSDRLWMINYAPHMPRGSEHKLYSVDQTLNLTIHPESVGGTPAARMIHHESNQLLIGPYLIDASRNVRVISPKVMPGRLTAIARHLTDPENMVYYADMEGAIYEANVRTLDVNLLFAKPAPGWHCKGAYTAQGRLVIANNGEHAAGDYAPLVVGGPAQNDDDAGVLAEWDGKEWRIIERRQYCDVTGPGGVYGNTPEDDRLWAIGWDRRSLRLKLLDDGRWHTYLLPKASHNNDPKHGWYTEWPRIREIGNGKWMMDMHGMFFDFPATFSAANSAGLRPISSHLRYIPDFCEWDGRLVLATDETSIQGNPLAGQPQSNLWFGKAEDLKGWGPASGYGGPWVRDHVTANRPSDPFMIGGFDRRTLHLAVGSEPLGEASLVALRASDQQKISSMPAPLANLPRLTIRRGDWHKPAPGYAFEVSHPATIFLAVDERGAPDPGPGWVRTDHSITWGADHRDVVYRQSFDAGQITIPGNATEHSPSNFGMPHLTFVACDTASLTITPAKTVRLTTPKVQQPIPSFNGGPVRFKLEVDVHGNGDWKTYETVEVAQDGYHAHIFPERFRAEWIRITTDNDCVATAYFHLTTGTFNDGSEGEQLFAGLADADSSEATAALLYAAKRNRNLRVVASDEQAFEFDKESFTFQRDEADGQLNELLKTEAEFTVDDGSVILNHRGKRLRLPKGHAAFDKPFATGWPRASREVESERHLANIHGAFYEVPLVTNGRPPAFELMRPVASHAKRITDYCTWNGLLVFAGVHPDAPSDGHVFSDREKDVSLWFGAIDDIWKFGKPVGSGGPWKNSTVSAGVPSDPYLMTGYDHKTLSLTADRDVKITIEIDVDHQSGWYRWKTIPVSTDAATTYEFPTGFSAHWVRFSADGDCRATAWLEYR